MGEDKPAAVATVERRFPRNTRRKRLHPIQKESLKKRKRRKGEEAPVKKK